MREPFHLTFDQVRLDLEAVVATDPDFTYPSNEDPRCSCTQNDLDDLEELDASSCPWHLTEEPSTCLYLHPDLTPACLVGHYYLNLLHLSPEAFVEGSAPKRILVDSGYVLEPGVVELLNAVQSNQDQGLSWSHSLQRALTHLTSEPAPGTFEGNEHLSQGTE